MSDQLASVISDLATQLSYLAKRVRHLESSPPGPEQTSITCKVSGLADHESSGLFAELTAASNVALGDICYINSDSKMALGDADGIANSKIIAMATESISADAVGTFLLKGFIRDDTWNWTVGGYIYLTVTGTTGNTLSQSFPTGTSDCVVIIGVAYSADIIYFNPQLVIVEHA